MKLDPVPPPPWRGDFVSTAQTITDHLAEHTDFEDFDVSARNSDGRTVVQFTDTETGCSVRVTIEEAKETEPALTDAEREQLTLARDKLVLLGVNAGDAWLALSEAWNDRKVRGTGIVTRVVVYTRDGLLVATVQAFANGTIEVRSPGEGSEDS